MVDKSYYTQAVQLKDMNELHIEMPNGKMLIIKKDHDDILGEGIQLRVASGPLYAKLRNDTTVEVYTGE